MTNLEKLIETLQKAPIEKTACFILHSSNAETRCNFCVFQLGDDNCNPKRVKDTCGIPTWFYGACYDGVKQWLESEEE